jgi:hypothetical protein
MKGDCHVAVMVGSVPSGAAFGSQLGRVSYVSASWTTLAPPISSMLLERTSFTI